MDGRPKSPGAGSRAVAWRTIAAFVLVQAVLLVGCEFGPIGRAAPHHTDVAIPEATAAQMMAGRVPYRDFASEYPPLALPCFGLAWWVGGAGAGFAWAFAAEALLFHTATLVLVARHDAPGSPGLRARLGWFLGYTLALWPVMLTRYDPIPTFFAFAAVVSWRADRPLGAGIWAGVGALIKLFPGFVLLPQMTGDWRGHRSAAWRARLGSGATVGVGMVAWLVVGGSGTWASIRYHSDRRIEIESTFASLIVLADAFMGRTPVVLYNYGAFHLVGDLADLASMLALPFLGSALLFVCLQVRGGADPARASCGCLLAFIVTNKVLSPQYLIWLIPFIVTLGGRRAGRVRALFAACCVLTTLDYPYFFFDLVDLRPLAIGIVAARNLILLVIALAVWAPDRDRGAAS